MRCAFATILLLAFGSTQAATVTLDFEEFSVGDSGELVSQGYLIGGLFSAGEIGIDTLEGSSNMYQSLSGNLVPERYVAVVELLRVDGNAFSLWSADWVFRDEYDAFSLDSFSYVRGELANGGTIVATSAAELGQGDWLNIVSASFVGDLPFSAGYPLGATKIMVDNIVVGAAVPIPAAVYLFGSGLGLLGWLRRRKTA